MELNLHGMPIGEANLHQTNGLGQEECPQITGIKQFEGCLPLAIARKRELWVRVAKHDRELTSKL
jgi:hypothetical protein